MTRPIKHAILTILFIGMLTYTGFEGDAWGRLMQWIYGKPQLTPLDPEESRRRYGFSLRDGAKKAGVDFVHQAPTQMDHRLAHVMPLIASMGAGVSVVDFDNDGHLDVYLVNSGEGSKNRLYRNKGDGTFEEVAEKMGVADLNQEGTGVCMGALWGDFDNDGYEDLLVFKWGKPEVYRNLQGKGFERVADAGLPDWINAGAAVLLDYDRDGRLDVFLAGYWADDVDLWNLRDTKIMPESFEYANNGGRRHLLRNVSTKGKIRFEDVTERAGIKSTRWALGLAAADLRGTGYPDVIVANDYGKSEHYANREGRRFEEIGEKTGIGKTPKSGMNVCLGDWTNEGKLSIYISNITEPGNLVQGNNLWVPQPRREGEDHLHYVNQAAQQKVERGGWSWGAQFGDLNNDGLLDLYLTNGYVSAGRKSYWYDYGKIAGGLSGVIVDANFWPPIGDQSLSGDQRKCVWLNRGNNFIDVGVPCGVTDTYDGRSVALADLGNRGVLDVLVANQKGPFLLYKNTVAAGRQWIQFALTGAARPGVAGGSNRSAIGAEVRVFWKQGAGAVQEQLQVVSGGSGYAAQNMRRLHFGLGQDATVEKVVVKWPSGKVQELGARHRKPGARHEIAEVLP